MDRTRLLLSGVAATLALLAAPAASATDEGGCDLHTELLAAVDYTVNGTVVASGTALDGNVHAGDTLTAQVTVAQGCMEQLTLVAYGIDASGQADVATAVSIDTGLFGEGTHNLTVQVPECLFQVDLVAGAAIETATRPEVLYQAEGRLLAVAHGGVACALQLPPVLPCPSVNVTAQADGSVLLEFAALSRLPADVDVGLVVEETAVAVLRATPGGSFEQVATLSATATSYVDATAAEGQAYLYAIVLVRGDLVLTLDCPITEVTTIPDFPTAFGATAAGVAGLTAYAAFRRRRKA